MDPVNIITRDATITLREINENNWATVANLRVSKSQEGNLASNPMSMLEGLYSEDAYMRAVYADETIVGFLMLALRLEKCEFYIWRFMIDKEYQKMGFGTTVVRNALSYIKQNYPMAKQVAIMSTPEGGKDGVAAEDSPFRFYSKLGFRCGGETDEDGDIQMVVDL